MTNRIHTTSLPYFAAALLLFTSCAVQKPVGKSLSDLDRLLADSTLRHAHVGVAVYDAQANEYLYQYNADKYFVPASNTKLFSFYAGLKHLGDSLPGIRYAITDKGALLLPTGDPTLLHPDFKRQPVIDFLKNLDMPLAITDKTWQSQALGAGWSWDDYNDYYMAERSPLPVYGNVLRWFQERNDSANADSNNPFDQSVSIFSIPEVNWKVRFNPDMKTKSFSVRRDRDANQYLITEGNEKHREIDVPFVTHTLSAALELLPDTIGKTITLLDRLPTESYPLETIYSQPVDSLFRPMMHRSDNFFAEQTLLMVSNEMLQVMNERKVIDSLLKSDFAGLPQPPHWVDGSGLSRFNLFSPLDFIDLLGRLKRDFGMDRIKGILPTGGTGTIRNYYLGDSSYIYAKTGTLNGVVAFSGYLYTQKGRLLYFSVLVNNHFGSAAEIRRKVEEFLHGIRMSH